MVASQGDCSRRKRLRDQYRSLDPVALLAEIRAPQDDSAIAPIVVPADARPAMRQHELRAEGPQALSRGCSARR